MIGPAADGFLDPHPINFIQSGDFVNAESHKDCSAVNFEVNAFFLNIRWSEREIKGYL